MTPHRLDPSRLHRIPAKDPVSGGELYASELANDESGVTIRGRFELPKYARLDEEQTRFLETFLRCRGMFNAVERELGMSYPTVRNRLDALLNALDLKPIEAKPSERPNGTTRADQAAKAAERAKILDSLDAGEITAEEAKQRLRERTAA